MYPCSMGLLSREASKLRDDGAGSPEPGPKASQGFGVLDRVACLKLLDLCSQVPGRSRG